MKRYISAILILCMVISMVPVASQPVLAAESEETDTEESVTVAQTQKENLWEYELYPEGVALTAYHGTATDVYVPATVDEYTVVKLGDGLFRDNDSLNSVTLGAGIEEIGTRCFFDCDNLVCIVTDEELTTIGAEAFYSCNVFNSIILYDAVTTIGENAFSDCPNVTIWCNESTIAYTYATENSIGYEILNPDATPETYIQDGVTYYIMNGEAIAVDFDEASTEVGIPATVEGYPVTQLRETFRDCTNLTSVTLPDSLRTIGGYSFYNCKQMTAVALPNSVSSIGFQAFGSCSKLTEIIIPKGVTDIDASTFARCSNLTSVTIPDSITSIGNYAFYFCTSLSSVTIPDSVTSIGTFAFGYCYKLASARIPDGVTKIEGHTFFDCRSLASVSIGSNVTSIGQEAFYSCDCLTSVVLPEGLSRIDGSAFSSCTGLTAVTLPNSVITIGNYAFSGCENLSKIIIPGSVQSLQTGTFPLSTVLLVYENSYAHSFAQSNDLLFFLYDGVNEPVVVKQTGITYYIMNGEAIAIDFDESITEVVMPSTVAGYPVTEMRAIFQGCTNLTAVTLPEGLRTIADSSFHNCTKLVSVVIPKGITEIGKAAFGYCYKLASITIPDTVTTIEENAFYQCSSLTSVAIPNSVTSLGIAFRYCSGLTSVTIGDGVTSINAETFLGCRSLNSVHIGDCVTSIAFNAFKDCTGLNKVIIPESVEEIYTSSFPGNTVWMVYEDSYAHTFAQTKGLLYFVFDGSNEPMLIKKDGITYYISDGEAIAIDFDESTTEVVIPAVVDGFPVTELRETFRSCGSLTSVTLPVGLKRIGSYSFDSCGRLASVTIPNTVTDIGNYAFNYSGLTAVTIPDSVISIGTQAFAYCDLASVTIPDSVTTLGSKAFYCCTALASATIGSGVTRIELQTFSQCYNLTSVTIPNSVIQIGDNAFAGCNNLVSITIPESVTRIGNSVFHSCSRLTSVTIPNSVTSMGYDVFQKCTSLASVKLPDGITKIESFVFNSCTSLTQITIPDGVTSIGSSAFAACTDLRQVLIPESVADMKKDSFATNTILMVYENSYAHTFAENNNLLYFVIRKTANPEISYGAGITGTVTYTDGTAASGATVEILYDDGAVKETVTTDSAGAYAFTYAEVGRYSIRVTDAAGNSASGGVSVKRMNVFDVFLSGDTNLILKKGWNVSGTVSEASALVTVTDSKGNVLASTQTVNSLFAFSNISNGTYVLKAETGSGSIAKEITVFHCDLSGIFLEIPKQNAVVWGYTEVEDRVGVCAPRNWVSVTLYNAEGVIVAQTKTDSEGKYTFENLPLGSYRIVAQTAEFRPDHHGRPFDRSYQITGFAYVDASVAGEYQADISMKEVHEQETGFSGKVTAHGQTQDSEVILRDVEGNEYARFITGKNGKYDFVNIPDGVYIITAITPAKGMGYTVITIRDGVVYGDMDITVYKDGKLTQMEVDFYADLGNCSTPEAALNLRGRIAQEKRLYDSLSSKEKKQLSKEYIATLNQLIEWTVDCSYESADGVILTNAGTVVSGDELEKNDSVTFDLTVEKTVAMQAGENGVENAEDFIYYDMMDTAGDSQICQYYEISMTKIVDGEERAITSVTKDTDATGRFQITMPIPEEYRGHKHYSVLHVHNGETVMLADLDDDPNTITFEVDAFSTFALASTDEILIPVTNAQIWQNDVLYGNYTGIEEAINGCVEDDQYVRLVNDAEVALSLTQDVRIDLNGYDLSGTITTNGYKIYGMDSTTTEYTCDQIGYFDCVDESGKEIVPVRHFTDDNGMRFMSVKTESGYTFHRFYMGITHVSLAPQVTGFGYRAMFCGDAMVQSQIASVGYSLWLTEERVISRTANFKNTLTLRLKNFDVAGYSETPVNAMVTMTLLDGTVIEGAVHTTTLRRAVESINENYAVYSDTQLAAMRDMIADNPIMQSWRVENICKEN